MNTVPFFGKALLAAIWLFAKAIGKLSAMPMTSPVERISGPRMMSTPGNLLKGNTLSFTEKYVGTTSCVDAQLVQRLAGHDERRQAGQRHVGRLGHERHRPARTRIHFQHVHRLLHWLTRRWLP